MSERVLLGSAWIFFSGRMRHTRYWRDWSSDVCSSDLHRRRIVERADGVPLYAVEIVRMLLDEGRVRREGDRYEIGRASRRERVKISVVAVSLKKKTAY